MLKTLKRLNSEIELFNFVVETIDWEITDQEPDHKMTGSVGLPDKIIQPGRG